MRLVRKRLVQLAPVVATFTAAFACSRTTPLNGDPQSLTKTDAAIATSDAAAARTAVAPPPGARECAVSGELTCYRFAAPADALRWIVSTKPLVLGVGESHAPRGAEHIASSTKRFTGTFLPMLAPLASDVVVELWAPDPRCVKEVKRVESAQKPVTEVQSSENQNEYVTLGTEAKAAGMTPWLLRPTCDDFSTLADAGADAVEAMLGLVKRLTQAKVTQLHARNVAEGSDSAKMVIAYGGALHNDLRPPESTRAYAFGPELDSLTRGRYVELDLIVPEFVKPTPVWEKLPWYASFEADQASGRRRDDVTLYVIGERSFVLIFSSTEAAERRE